MGYHLHAHVVFVPKYRQEIFVANALGRLRDAIRVVCADFETDLVAFNREPFESQRIPGRSSLL